MVEAVFNYLSIAGDEGKLKEIRAQLNSPFELRVSPDEIMKFSNPVFAFWNITKPSDLETYFSDLEFTPENVLDTLTASGDHWFNWNTRNWGTAKDVAAQDNEQSSTILNEYITNLGGLAYTFYTEMTAPFEAIITLSKQFPNETFELSYESSAGWGGVAKFINGNMETAERYAFKCPTCDWMFDEYPELTEEQIDDGSCPECADEFEDEDVDIDNSDFHEVLDPLLNAAKSGDTDAMEQVANIAFQIGNVELAKEWLTVAAAHGRLQSMHDLGLILKNHDQDLDGARALWQMAADQGNHSAINSLIYTFWLAEKQWDKIDEYAQKVIAADAHLETTNTIANLGISHYLQGNQEQAIKYFMQALNRPDGFAEGEASYFLSRIYREQGDDELALSFEQRCDRAGGYIPGIQLDLDVADSGWEQSAVNHLINGDDSSASKIIEQQLMEDRNDI